METKVMQKALIISVVFACGCYAAAGHFEHSSESQSEQREFILAGIPVWMALNAPPRGYGLPQRTIFLVIEGRYFSEVNLRKVFSHLAAEHPEPMALSISAFSDANMVRRAVDNYKYPLTLDFPNTPDGHRAQEEYYEKHYPLKTGYYRAFYWRSHKGKESFKYSPDPDKDEFITVPLK